MESSERTKHGRVNLTKAVNDLQRKLRSTAIKNDPTRQPFDINRPTTSINIRPTTAPAPTVLIQRSSPKKGEHWREKKEKIVNKVYTEPFFNTDHYRNVRYGQDLYLKPCERYRKPAAAKLTAAQILDRLERVTNPPGYMGNRDDIRHDSTKTDRAAITMTANDKILCRLTGAMFDDNIVEYIADARRLAARLTSAQQEQRTIRFQEY